MTEIIVAGHICLDLLPGMGDVPLNGIATPGMLFEVDALDMSTGGAVANCGLALHILGADVGLMGKVGNDLIGRVILASLNDLSENLSEMVKVEEGSASSYTIVLSPQSSDRIFLHCPGTNDTFSAEDIDLEAVKEAKLFFLGYPPLLPRMYQNEGSELAQIFEQAKATGVITAMDTAQPDPNKASGQVAWQPILEKTLPNVDIFIPSIEETVFMLRRDDFDKWNGDVLANIDGAYLRALAEELIEMGVAVTGFKLSKYGFFVRVTKDIDRLTALSLAPINLDVWVGAEAYHPAFEVEVIGTTGAGDASYAAFLSSLMRGLSPQEAVKMACAVGAHNVEAAGAVAGLRSWDETVERIEQGWNVQSGDVIRGL